MKILTIIPARGGSKGIPQKNVRPFAGHPLIAWSIDQSLRSKHIERTIVSTDDEEIRQIALKYGAEVPFLRPAELARDDSPTEPSLLHVLDELKKTGYEPDAVILLQPTSPIRFDGTLDRAIEKFQQEKCDSLLTVFAVHHLYWKNADSAEPLYDHMNRPRHQDMKEEDQIYAETGSIYVTKASVLRKEKNRLAGKIGMLPTKREESIDIDTEEDFLLAEEIARLNREKLIEPRH